MGFLNDFQLELVSQTTIIDYIKICFEKELYKAKEFLNIDINENLYNNNADYMKLLNSACDDLLDKNLQLYISERPLPKIVQNVDVEGPIGQALEYCNEIINNGCDLNITELKEELEQLNRDDYNFTKEQLNQIIEASYIIRDHNINIRIEEQDNAINLLKTAIKLVDNSSSANIFRQSFINIFSVFDAYVFEYLKKFFYVRPDELEKFFDVKNNEKIKVTLDEISHFDNIEKLKMNMVNRQFDGKYLKDLIIKLYKYKRAIFNGIKYIELMEMIERRNIHLHNKGFVDNKYFDSFNIYKFNIGDYAYIDNEYLFIKVMNTLAQFSSNIERELCIENNESIHLN